MKLLITVFACLLTAAVIGQEDKRETPQWRPVYHFTPVKNWTNDPNGLIYVNGEFKLYYQHNPYENKWGHMSWGHASSKDLVHWKHYPVAIPEKIDKDTTWIFSGSAVYDKNNTSGFCQNGGCLVAIYTAHQPNLRKESQFIAYSNDGGLTYTNYEKNPVIDLQKTDFRDPSVSWNEQMKKWLMVVALPLEYKVHFYSSPNLKDWTLLSEFGGNQGYFKNAWECPSLIQLPVDGNNANKKWVLFISSGGPNGGPFMQYFVGDFDGTTFKNDSPAASYLTFDYGNTYYAAIPYNDAPGGKEIMLGWMMPLKTPTYPWRGQMSIARDLSLKSTPEGIRIFQQPSGIVRDALLKPKTVKTLTRENVDVNNTEIVLNSNNDFGKNAYWVEAEIEAGTAKDFGFKLAKQKAVINYNVSSNALTVTTDSATQIHRLTATLKPQNGKIKLQILLDKSSLEVFGNNGEKAITTYIFPNEGETQLSFYTQGGSAKLSNLKGWNLSE